MTAEVVIMNREAVALASDSAVTSVGRGGQKIFTSANKLFSLSRHNPVGIMVYGNAKIMDMPWETIVKTYRSKLGKRKFARLEEYADDFIKYIDNNIHLFPENVQERGFKGAIESYYRIIKDDIKEKIKSTMNISGSISNRELAKIVSKVIDEHRNRYNNAEVSPSVSENYQKVVAKKFRKFIDEALDKYFEKLPISRWGKNHLRMIATELAYKFPEGVETKVTSGVVIAGFGDKEYFPALKAFIIERVVCDKLKYNIERIKKIDTETHSRIIPFAQHEVVSTFMEGIDPILLRTEESYLAEVFKKCIERVSKEVKGLDDKQKASVIDKLTNISKEEVENSRKKLETFRKAKYIEPVMSVVSMLPKDELAAMAETFVNLTSFKRKVTMEPETVGGPIDVALISKGDGFVWIKRKHYFDPKLNPHFFLNYNREVENENR